jgi:electron transfer flavoprotein beta subunit
MKIVVGLKHVPDTETKIKIGSDGRSIDETGVKWIASPFDEYALEAALRLATAGGAEVVLVSAGRADARATLQKGLAMGADRAILIEDERLERCDALLRARALAAVVREEQAELVLLGKYGVGTDEGQTGPMLAQLLGWPNVSSVSALDFAADGFRAEREIEGAVEVVEGRLPVVITCDKGLNEPRYASLKGIMAAKKKPITSRAAATVGLDEAALSAPMLVWESLEMPPSRRAGRRIDGSPAEAAAELIRLLRDEAKVI